MKKILSTLLVGTILIATCSFASDFIKGYKTRESHKSLENVLWWFMELKAQELKEGRKEFSMSNRLYFWAKDSIFGRKDNSTLLFFRQACYKAAQARLMEYDFDHNDPGNIETMKATLPSEDSTYESARNQFMAAASSRWIDYEAERRARQYAGKKWDERPAMQIMAAHKVFTAYFDDLMLQNPDWFKDSKGNLHVPKFLRKKFKEKYPNEVDPLKILEDS